jgi:hypothetical protein
VSDKYCVDCKHFRNPQHGSDGLIYGGTCWRVVNRDRNPVTGMLASSHSCRDCAFERSTEWHSIGGGWTGDKYHGKLEVLCGPSGRYFEPKE